MEIEPDRLPSGLSSTMVSGVPIAAGVFLLESVASGTVTVSINSDV